MTDELPTREQIVEEIHSGQRDPVDDAEMVHARDKDDIEVIHEASDGQIRVRYTYHQGYSVDGSGGTRGIDAMGYSEENDE